MGGVLADTHALLWYLTNTERLSPAALSAMDEATANGGAIYISAISLIEVYYLAEKSKLTEADATFITAAVLDADSGLIVAPVDQSVAISLRSIPRDSVPDLPDRIICATAILLDVPLVTRDVRIRSSIQRTIW